MVNGHPESPLFGAINRHPWPGCPGINHFNLGMMGEEGSFSLGDGKTSTTFKEPELGWFVRTESIIYIYIVRTESIIYIYICHYCMSILYIYYNYIDSTQFYHSCRDADGDVSSMFCREMQLQSATYSMC